MMLIFALVDNSIKLTSHSYTIENQETMPSHLSFYYRSPMELSQIYIN